MWFILALLGGGYAISRLSDAGDRPALGTLDVLTIKTIKTLRDPGEGEKFVDLIFYRSEKLQEAIKQYAASRTSPDWAKLSAAAQAKKKEEEAAARQLINDTTDKYRDIYAKGAAMTGIGIVAVPFIYFAAGVMKWAGNAQLTILKTLGITSDGWSETWLNNMNGELDWLITRGIPFPAWGDGKVWVSPMGWVNGGGGSTCGHGGLCAIREAYGVYLEPLDMESAMRAWRTLSRHLADNPIALAFYTRVAMSDGGFQITNGFGFGNDNGVDVQKLFIAALVTSVCQDRGVPFARWEASIAAVWPEWQRLFEYHKKRGESFPFAGSVGSVYDYTVAIADKEVVASGGLLSVKSVKF